MPWSGLHAYAVPEALAPGLTPGAAVRVPIGRGNRVVEGLCLGVSQQPWDHTRLPIIEATPGPSWLSPALLDLGLWISEYYACWPWKTFAAMLPLVARQPRMRRVNCIRLTGQPRPERLTGRQIALLDALAGQSAGGARPAAEGMPRREAIERAGVSDATVRTLARRGLIECFVRREPVVVEVDAGTPQPVAGSPCREDEYELTGAQQAALDQVDAAVTAAEFRVFLLFGVPGSGKTEVYVRAIRRAIEAGKQAILLIPEIALATQIVERLARRFGRVAVLHSQLASRLRQETLAAIAAGAVDVVIGTRTAVFAPCPRLGVIVVDEEQEPSFKNLAMPHYHARDVAIKRGQLEGVPVVLGSATPALETWYNAQHRGHYRLLRLPERVPGASLPLTRLVETPGRRGLSGTAGLSAELREELSRVLEAGQQAILLHNRRGYAVFLRCQTCGLLLACERCGRHLVLHQSERQVKCHQCGRRGEVPPHCTDPTCRGPLQRTGWAIQRLEEELAAAFPSARLLRLDRDTMRRRSDYEAALRAFEQGEADIMLGTQMVAKGLDFPNVRLVGVLEADAALAVPDFRAGERAFQLVVQVVGRAGRRDGESLALVETGESPPAPIRHALALDYESFAVEELAAREAYAYPPYVRLVRFVCADSRPNRARAGARELAERLVELAGRVHPDIRVDGASACVVARLRDLFRFQVLVRGPRDASIPSLLRLWASQKSPVPRVERFRVDPDPQEMM